MDSEELHSEVKKKDTNERGRPPSRQVKLLASEAGEDTFLASSSSGSALLCPRSVLCFSGSESRSRRSGRAKEGKKEREEMRRHLDRASVRRTGWSKLIFFLKMTDLKEKNRQLTKKANQACTFFLNAGHNLFANHKTWSTSDDIHGNKLGLFISYTRKWYL